MSSLSPATFSYSAIGKRELLVSDELDPEFPAEGLTEHELAFEFIKGNQFRVIHVDGAVGGMTPQGLIHMAVYSERLPIPQRVVHRIADEAHLGEEIREKRVVRQAIIRELEASLMMDMRQAYALCRWLADILKKAGALVEDSPSSDPSEGTQP